MDWGVDTPPFTPQDILFLQSGWTPFILGGLLVGVVFDAVGVGRDTPKLPSPSAPPNTTETKDGGHKVTPTTPPSHSGVGAQAIG